MITSSITLGSIVFGDVEFEGWSFRELIDWWGQTEDKLDVVERPQAHGAFDVTRSLRASRAISFTGTFIGSSQAEVEGAFDALASVGAEGPVEMTVTTPAGASSRTVTVERVAPVDHRGRRYGSFSVDVIARDPRRYDVNTQTETSPPAQPGHGRTWPAVWPLVWPGGGSSGRIMLTNAGRAPSAPTFILSGGFDTALITCLETGARIGFDRPVSVGSQVVIDVANRRATIDGTSDVSRWLRFREWEAVPGGASRTFQFDATGVVSTPGSSVEVRRNLIRSTDTSGSAGWTPTSGALVAESGRLKFTQNASSPNRLGATTVLGATRAAGTYMASFRVETSAPSVAGVRVLLYDPASTSVRATTTLPLTPGGGASTYWFPLTATGVFDVVYMEFYGAPVAAGAVGYISEPILEVGATQAPWFNGSFSPDPLLTPSWVGAVGQSESVLSNVTPPMVFASLEGQVRSAWW